MTFNHYSLMNTNDSQFLKAYNDLVTAFFKFMNVVNPQGSQQPNLSYVASQLNQLLNYLAATPQSGAPTTPQQPADYPAVPDPQPMPQTQQTPQMPQPTTRLVMTDPVQLAANPTSDEPKYCSYPEPVNGRYKFKSSSITNAPNEDSVYKLCLNENTQDGYVEICPLSGDTLKIVANNPSLYMPLDICSNAGSITPDKNSVSSRSKLRLVKVVRGWEIADGEKFVLDIN